MLGTWKILKSGAFVTLDIGNDEHQDLLDNPPGNELILRDDGLAGTTDQDSAPLPIHGDWSLYVAVVDAATYSAGGIVPVIADPINATLKVRLAQGAGSPSAAGVIHATLASARATVLHGPIPRGTMIRCHDLLGDGTGKLLVRCLRWPSP